MEIIIFTTIYWIFGFAYIRSISTKKPFQGEWPIDAIIAPIWPYIMLLRFFIHRRYIAEQKRIKAHKEANR